MTTMEDSASIIARLNQEWAIFKSTEPLDEQTRKTAEMAVFRCQQRLRLRGEPFFLNSRGQWRLGGSSYGNEACWSGLQGLAQGISRHSFITAKMEQMSKIHQELMELVGTSAMGLIVMRNQQ